jgi:membrane protein implicated in regulation of membrane protease activity
MWAIAGVLLGLFAVTAFAGFHFGPHTHAASTLFGVAAAVFLVILALTGNAEPLLFALLGADVAVTGGIAVITAKGFSQRAVLMSAPVDTIVGAFATALDTLDPEGTVRVGGEVWSATALNPPIRAGTSVHVVGRSSLRLEVWADTGDDPAELFSIEAGSAESRPRTSSAEQENNNPDSPADAGAGDERTPSL